MIRMILADDEPVITRGIRKLLDWERLGIEIIGEYEDGKRALEAIVSKKPEIALLDISMPGMTGVEILKECRAMGSRISIIFVSGFQDFEYAKAALEYGATAYLLKPVIREELLAAVEKSIPALRREDAAGKAVPEEAAMEAGIDYGFLMEEENTRYVPVYADIMYKKEENGQMKKLIHFSIFSFLEEYLNETGQGIAFLKNERIAMVFKGLSREEVKEILEDMWEKSLETTGRRIFFVLGDEVGTMSGIPEMFQRCRGRGGYLFFADRLPLPVIGLHEQVFSGRGNSELLTQTRQRLFEAVAAQNEALVKETCRQYGTLVCRLSEGKKEDACFYFCTAARFLEEKCIAVGLPGRSPEMKELLEKNRECMSFGEMEDFFEQELEQYLGVIRAAAVSQDKKDILRAKEYIEKHYMENLSLNVLAEEIHMNPYYFSSFFKKSTGENFKDYVNRIRVRHALPLLISTDMKTYEIAEKVGFGEVRIFNAAFQKIYQETPGSYRRRVSSGSEGE